MAKKIIVYGSADCPHCVVMKEALDKEGIKYGYVDILASLGHLKKYLNVRDQNPEKYEAVRAEGRVGIPTMVVDDTEIIVGTVENIDLETLK